MKKTFISALALCSMSTALAANPERIADVLNSLDLSRSELAGVAEALQKKDLNKAKKSAADFFREQLIRQNKLNQPGKVDLIHNPVRPCNKKTAADAVKGKIKVVNIYYTFPGGKIDWLFNPTKAKGQSLDPEWLWQLNRMSFWADMAAYYEISGDTLYAQRIVEQLRSWIDCQACPGAMCNVQNSVWRTIECGIRLGITWPQTFQKIAEYPGFTDDDLLLYMSSSLEQMRHLLANYRRTGGNWLTMEMNGVYTFASDFPQFRESSAARRRAVELLKSDLEQQILPDGIQYELSPGYHFVTLGNSMSVFIQAQKRGFLNEIPPDFLKLLERGFEGMTKMTMPNRCNPAHNDGGSGILSYHYQKCRKLFPENKLISWMAEGAPSKDPRSPELSSLLPWCGFVIMRSSWAKNANALFFDAGPLGKGHIHQDKLNLVLHGYGEELLFDDGGGFYEESIFRDYGRSAWDHSVIAVDRQGQNREHTGENRIPTVPPQVTFQTTPEYDYAEAVYDQGFGEKMERIAVHTRQVLFLKPDLFIVCDKLVPGDDKEHHYEARWQIDAASMLEASSGILRSKRKGKADLEIAPIASEGVKVVFVSGKTGKKLSEMGGLYIGYKVRPWRPAVTVSHEKTGKGAQMFLTLLHPVRKENGNPVSSIKRTGAQEFEIRFKDGKTAVILQGDRLSAIWKKK